MINCNVVAPCSVGTFEAKITLSQTVLYLLKDNVRGIAGANAARESGLCILMTVYRCLFRRGWSKYKLVIKKGTSELDEAMKKDSHYLFADPGVLGEIIKCPTLPMYLRAQRIRSGSGVAG